MQELCMQTFLKDTQICADVPPQIVAGDCDAGIRVYFDEKRSV